MRYDVALISNWGKVEVWDDVSLTKSESVYDTVCIFNKMCFNDPGNSSSC